MMVFHHAVGEILLLRVAAHVLKRQHGDGGPVGEQESGFRLFRWSIADRLACGPLRFPNCTDETEALARQCLDQALFLAGIADRSSRGIQARRKRPIGHDTAVPNGIDEIVFADHARPVSDQVIEQVEYLWRYGNEVRPAI